MAGVLTLHLVLLVLAVLCFALAALRVSTSVDLMNAGFALVIAAWIADEAGA